jgi:alpha-glucosidase
MTHSHIRKFPRAKAVGRALLLFLALVECGVCAEREPRPIEHKAQIGEGIALFVPQGYSASKTPSLAFATAPRESGAVPPAWNLVPKFYLDDGKAGASLDLPNGSSLYGTGEVTGPLLRNGKTIALWNTDSFGYGRDNGRRLYQSHPWVLGVRPDGTAFGVLFDTTWKAELQTNSDRIVLNSEGPPFRVVVIDRESPQAVMRGLGELIGMMPLPPRWALGFHQCRYSYYPDARVREIADEFRKRRLPCDVIWMDIHYMDGFRVFTFDPKHFPDPAATNDYLHKAGFHSVWMIDPGVKAERGYSVYDSGSRQGIWVQTGDGKEFAGKVWPGVCAFPDFTMPSARQWWADLYKDFVGKGVDGVWNDMNEPAVFDGPDSTMPEDNIHRGGGDLPAGSHRMYHNVFGMLMTRATREGVLKARPEQRPFVLTRANHLGGQRYAATWTGDNVAKIEFLKTSVPMSLNLGLSGQPLSGADIGGYEGNATPELFGKWIALGAFYPFCRAHASVSSQSQEPWAFGPEIENVSRTALERRYRLFPYLYTLAFNSSVTGEPIMQPVFFADPKDANLRSEDSAFLFGPDLLVVPQWSTDPKLPKGIWRGISLLDAKREEDGYQPALKMRGGAIIPLGTVVQNTNEPSLRPLTLLVCLDQNNQATGTLYEDSGDGFGYQKGDYALTRYRATRDGDVVVVRIEKRDGHWPIADREIEVRVIMDDVVMQGRGSESKGVRVPLAGPATAQLVSGIGR